MRGGLFPLTHMFSWPGSEAERQIKLRYVCGFKQGYFLIEH
jgi:hypothetical protein